MHIEIRKGLVQIRCPLVACHLLFDEQGAVLVDAGFAGDLGRIENALLAQGLCWEDLKAILLTHGHLDHTFNVAKIVSLSGAKVYGHLADSLHYKSEYPYFGLNRICGLLEWVGRSLFGFERFEIDHWIEDGDVLDFWGGLTVVHTPGHTAGHCSYFSERERLLFAGDLFVSWKMLTLLPWPGLNSCSRGFTSSIDKVESLNLGGIILNHGGVASPEEIKQRFIRKDW